MATPSPFLAGRVKGMWRDSSRDVLPPGFVWNLEDFLLDRGAPLRKRGGWRYASDNISTASTGATYIAAVSYNIFTAATKICAITDNGKLATMVPGTLASTAVGTVVANLPPKQSPVQHRQTLVIPSGDGSTANSVKSYDGVSTIATLGGSPPLGQYACVYRDRTVLANSVAQPQRVQFSAAGDPTTWTSTSWIDTSYPVTGIAPLRNAILVFSKEHCERIRGTTPPPGTDMSLEPVFNHGCLDARSIASYGENVIFAASDGVFITDGAAVSDLTEIGGMKSYWIEITAGATSSWTFAGGVFQDEYRLVIMNAANESDVLVCDLKTKTWRRENSIKAIMFASARGVAEELYWALRDAPYVVRGSTMYTPTADYKQDEDAHGITPIVETGFVHGGSNGRATGRQTFKAIFGNYDLRDAASDNPILTVSYVTSPESTSYTTITGTLPETTKETRFRRGIGSQQLGLGFKVAQSNNSSDTYIYSLEAQLIGREPSRI